MNDAEVLADNRYAITRYSAANDVVALQGQRRITRAEFQREVMALAARMPAHQYIVNLCTNRYRFTTGLAAALIRRQISLMPSSDAPGVLKAVAKQYPDLYALTDPAGDAPNELPPLPCFAYPNNLGGGSTVTSLPEIPEAQPALILFTSGSTGQPKPVAKSWGPLVRSARAAGARLGLSNLPGATIISTVPHQHSYGLESTILLGLQHGLVIDAGWPLYPGDIRAAIERAPQPRILVTTPVHLRILLAEPEAMPPVDLILSATAPLPPALAVAAEARFGARLVEIYGCTEAGQVATRRSAATAQWQCLDGVRLSQNEHGTWASGAAVEGTALLQDLIETTGPGTFLLGDRSADLVDVAGKRASLAHLNEQLLSIAGVRDGVFFMGENDGKRVARLLALVVADLPPKTILQKLRDLIDPAFLPRPLVLLEHLPRNTLGKLPREALLRLAGAARKPDA